MTRPESHRAVSSVSQSDRNEVFDEAASAYSAQIDEALGGYGAKHDFFTRHKAELIRKILKKWDRQAHDTDLLDIGCGVGNIHKYLLGEFKSISGCDVSAASIEVARKQFPAVDYFAYDGGRLPLESGTIDMSLAICVWHHVPHAELPSIAREMLRVLKPGGMALVIEHNPHNPITRRIVNSCPLDRDAVLLPARATRAIFREAGAEVVATRSILNVPPVNAWLAACDDAMGWLPLGAQYYCVALKPSTH